MSGIRHRCAVRVCGPWRPGGGPPGMVVMLACSMAEGARGVPGTPRLCDLAVDQVEIVLPVRPVWRLLPHGPDRRAVITERPREALPEARRLPPHLPDAPAEAHLIHA